jgi:hypothetical protein
LHDPECWRARSVHDVQGTGSFGLTLENVTPQMARRLRLPSGRTGAVIADVDADGSTFPFRCGV